MTGHVRRRGERSWELKFDIGADPATGTRRIRYHSFKGTKREAELELARLVSANAKGEYVDPSKVTLAEFLDRWERDWAAANVSPKTLERYLELLRKHVRPRIGSIRLQKLQPVMLNELYAGLLRNGRGDRGGLAPRTVGHVHRVLHRAVGHAAQWRVVQQNIVSLVSPPRVPSTEINILTPAQVRTVLGELRGRYLHPVCVLALATGMRRGELVGLRWQDIDFERARLRVERSVEQTKKGLRIKSPKTRHGRRTITLPPSAVAELREHWANQQQQRLRLGAGKAPPDFTVFATWEGKLRTPNSLTKDWSQAMEGIALPTVTLHSLRHTHASELIASGLDVLTVSRRLGHSTPAITLNVYGHLFAHTEDRAAQIMEAALTRNEGK